MSERLVTECDRCTKRTEDPYSEHGWIKMKASTISLHAGRNSHSDYARSASYAARMASEEIDFCSTDCLIALINELHNRAQRLYPEKEETDNGSK